MKTDQTKHSNNQPGSPTWHQQQHPVCPASWGEGQRSVMNTTEAARIAGRTPTTIRNWIAKGRLQAGTAPIDGPPWVIWDITPEALEAAIATQRKPGRPYKHPQVVSEETK